MDRRLKERLVGATILVVLIVLIVPELLSGPKTAAVSPPAAAPVGATAAPGTAQEATRNVTVDLATSKATSVDDGAASAPPLAGAAADDAAQRAGDGAHQAGENDELQDSAASSVPARAASQPVIVTLKAQQGPVENPVSPPTSAGPAKAAPTKAAPAKAAPPASSHEWAVQLGSFASRANAEKQVHLLKAAGSTVYVSSSGNPSSQHYRVRIGPFADRAAAEKALKRLRREGHPGSLVPP